MKKTVKSLTLIILTSFFLMTSITFFPYGNKYVPTSISAVSNSKEAKGFINRTDSAAPVSSTVRKVIPCGQPFGIKMLTEGIVVVRLSDINGKDDSCPAKEAGIQVGDIIISVGGEKITSNEDLSKVISSSGGDAIEVVVKRNGSDDEKSSEEELTLKLTPEYCNSEKCYKTGMWIRDSSAGIGTITFYDPSTGAFGGLGHPICDSDTGEVLPLSSGEICDVSITGYKKGENGNPGELHGRFLSDSQIGTVAQNTNSGVFGSLDESPSKNEEIEIADNSEVKTGKAEILTTISGSEPQKYSINIEQVNPDDPDCKNLVIRVTDKTLLEKTGGILQGMSGSPIIQKGKLVGAVTHVFVNNSSMGYGIFANTMFTQSQLNISNSDVCLNMAA